jgi:hypothetical protein
MITSCGPTIKTIKYSAAIQYILDEDFSLTTQEYENVFITARVLGLAEIPKIIIPLYVTYIPSSSKEHTTEQKQFEVNIFSDYTILDITLNNQSEYDLAMSGYQFLYIGPNNTIYATKYSELGDKRQIPTSLKYLHDDVMKKYPMTDEKRLVKDMLWAYNNYIDNNLGLLNGINRIVHSQTSSTGILLFPVKLQNSINGIFSIRETSSNGNDLSRRSKIAAKYDYKIKSMYLYRKSQVIDGERSKEDWIPITEQEYNNERYNPKKYWYNDTTKIWVEGDVPKK